MTCTKGPKNIPWVTCAYQLEDAEAEHDSDLDQGWMLTCEACPSNSGISDEDQQGAVVKGILGRRLDVASQ